MALLKSILIARSEIAAIEWRILCVSIFSARALSWLCAVVPGTVLASYLSSLPRMSLQVSTHIAAEGDARKITVSVSNPTPSVALAVRLKVVRNPSNERVLPGMYEDNYFSILPHESKTVDIRFLAAALAGETPMLMVEGWNINQESHSL